MNDAPSAGSAEFDLSREIVALCMPNHRDMHASTAVALAATEAICLAQGVRLSILTTYGVAFVHVARCKLAAMMLASEATMMFTVDSDMAWQAQDFMRMVALASKLGVVGASYVMRQDEVKFVAGGMDGPPTKEAYGCVSWPTLVMGLGFTCVQRRIVEDLAAHAPKLLLPNDTSLKVVPRIFRNEERATEEATALGADLQLFGEDVNFFHDVEALGHDVWLDPSVRLGHIGTKTYSADIREWMQTQQQGAQA